jgi:hypothetical protein
MSKQTQSLSDWYVAFNDAASWRPHSMTLTKLLWNEQRNDIDSAYFVYRDGVFFLRNRFPADPPLSIIVGGGVEITASLKTRVRAYQHVTPRESFNVHEKWVPIPPGAILRGLTDAIDAWFARDSASSLQW